MAAYDILGAPLPLPFWAAAAGEALAGEEELTAGEPAFEAAVAAELPLPPFPVPPEVDGGLNGPVPVDFSSGGVLPRDDEADASVLSAAALALPPPGCFMGD